MTDAQEITNKDLHKLLQSVLNKNIEIENEIKQNRVAFKQEILELKKEFSQQFQDIKNENEILKKENKELKAKINIVERKTKKYSFIVYGLKEDGNNLDDIQQLLNLCNESLNLPCTFSDFRDIFRIGNPAEETIRPLVAEVVSYQLKSEIINNSKVLKGSGISIAHDYTSTDYKNRKLLGKNLYLARNHNLNAHIKNNILFIESHKYTVEDLARETPKIITERVNKIDEPCNSHKIDGKDDDRRLDNTKLGEKTGAKRKQQDHAEGSKLKRSARIFSSSKI